MLRMFAHFVNVESKLKRITNLLNVNGDKKEIINDLKEIENYITFIIKNHGNLHPNETTKLNQVLGVINTSVKSGLTLAAFENIKRELNDVFNFTRVYLMRHPERPKKGQINKWGAMEAIQKMEMSRGGVAQARAFARYLSEEIILCPKPVRVIFCCSELERTWLYDEIIRRELVRLTSRYGKHIIIAEKITNHPALNFRFSKECLAELDEEYKKSDFGAFSKWFQGGYTNCPHPPTVVSEVEAWVRENLAHDSTQAWTIVIGVSHSFIIDSFLYLRTGEHRSIIATADYAKFVGSSMYYKGKWY